MVANPQNRSQVCTWRITETRDTFGNRIVYDYLRDNDQSQGHDAEQLYLKRIRYVDPPAGSDAPFFISVEFLYDQALGAADSATEWGFFRHREIRILRFRTVVARFSDVG